MMMNNGQPMVMVQANPINFMKALEKLEKVPGVYIKQKFELLEAMTGCETENKYVINAADQSGEKAKKMKLFKAKEKSSCF